MIDNYGLWERHDAEQQAWLDSLLKCNDCKEPIQDESIFEVDGETLCEECMNKRYKKPNPAI